MQYMCSARIEQTKDDAIITFKHACENCGGTHIYVISCDIEIATLLSACVLLESKNIDWSDESSFNELLRKYRSFFQSYKECNCETN